MAAARRKNELDGRTAANLAVSDALAGRRFVGETLRHMRADGRLAGREAALAMEVGQGAVRHAVTIEHVLASLAQFDRRRVAPRLRAVLLTAVYQIIWMDRIPPSAAVNQAVELARRLVGGRSPRMVNAVLRRVTDAVLDRRVPWRRLDPALVRVSWDAGCQFRTAVLPLPGAGEQAHLAASVGERPARYGELVRRFGAEQAEAIAGASQAIPAMAVQRNALRIAADALEVALRDAFGEAVEFAREAAFLPPSAALLDTALFREGKVYVQDSTAHAAALAVEARAGERVLDLCAAPGGKSVTLALQMQDEGEVVACDADPQRLARVRENADRLDLACIRPRRLPRDPADPPGPRRDFDAALVDVPCSNTGVIARRPEARLGFTPRKLRALVETQGRLLRQAVESVRAGGRVVYSTCSIEPEENQEVVAAFLRENPAWRLDAEETILPAWGPRWSDWRDGGYFARLVHGAG